jgi:hypothetical protein
VQGYDREVIEQFLAAAVQPTVIHFGHWHTPWPQLDALYRRLVQHGYRFHPMGGDTVCHLP